MILSVSRRTDIPACYPQWLLNRLREGFVLVRNPMNPHQVSRIALTPEMVDCIVFWTKDPQPLMPYLPEIDEMGYAHLLQVTLTGYGADVEANLPPVEARIAAMQQYARVYGHERLVWRYDPILLTDSCTTRWHGVNFARLARELAGYTERCVLSFLDLYPKIRSRLADAGIRLCTEDDMRELAAELSGIAASQRITLQTCAERIDLSAFGVQHGACVDGELISRIVGQRLQTARDGNQRGACGCVESIDIGAYNTCRNGCIYCYANHSPQTVTRLAMQHDPDSPLLIGTLSPEDRVTERRVASLRPKDGQQLSMF